MGAPFSYARECGPVALAAVTGLDLQEAADLLWGVRRAWGGTGPTSGPGGILFGTPLLATGDALVRLGWGVELWRGEGGGVLMADRTMYPGLLSRLAHARARRAGGRETAAEDRAPGRVREREELAPLSTWRERLRAGYWLYTVLPPGDDTPAAHLVACWGQKVLAGDIDGRYDDVPVWQALRALPPEETEGGETDG